MIKKYYKALKKALEKRKNLKCEEKEEQKLRENKVIIFFLLLKKVLKKNFPIREKNYFF